MNFLHGNDKKRIKSALNEIEATNNYTTQVLYRLGFQWPPT